MKNIVIIEDEAIAAVHLQRLLAQAVPDASVLAVLQSIEEAVDYFKNSQSTVPDVVFMDIHLADGPAFRIFDQVDIASPIIFTTAYDQYALQAFKVNSIDYLLKPIALDDLQRALDKQQRLANVPHPASPDLQSLLSALRLPASGLKSLLIPIADKLVPLRADNIACACIHDGTTRIFLLDGAAPLSVDTPLDTLAQQLDPDLFFRANRQYLVNHRAIKEIALWPIGKLAVTLAVDTPDRIVVSKAKVPEFKQWFTK